MDKLYHPDPRFLSAQDQWQIYYSILLAFLLTAIFNSLLPTGGTTGSNVPDGTLTIAATQHSVEDDEIKPDDPQTDVSDAQSASSASDEGSEGGDSDRTVDSEECTPEPNAFEASQTLLIFEWTNVFFPDAFDSISLRKSLTTGSQDQTLSSFVDSVRMMESCALSLLRTARKLGTVIILTDCLQSTVDKTGKSFAKAVLKYLEGSNIEVISLSNDDVLCQSEHYHNYSTWKRKKLEDFVKNRFQGNELCNIISVGSEESGHNATADVARSLDECAAKHFWIKPLNTAREQVLQLLKLRLELSEMAHMAGNENIRIKIRDHMDNFDFTSF